MEDLSSSCSTAELYSGRQQRQLYLDSNEACGLSSAQFWEVQSLPIATPLLRADSLRKQISNKLIATKEPGRVGMAPDPRDDVAAAKQ